MNKTPIAIFLALSGLFGPAAASAEAERKAANEEARNAIASVKLLPAGRSRLSLEGGLVFPGEGKLTGFDLRKPINRHGTSLRMLAGGMIARYDERPGPGPGVKEWSQTMAFLPVGLEQNLLSLSIPARGRTAVEVVPRVGLGASVLGFSCTGRQTPSKSQDCHKAAWTVIPYLSSGVDINVKAMTLGVDYGRFFDTVSNKTLEYQGVHFGVAFDGAEFKNK